MHVFSLVAVLEHCAGGGILERERGLDFMHEGKTWGMVLFYF
jgi:hypothetical protein